MEPLEACRVIGDSCVYLDNLGRMKISQMLTCNESSANAGPNNQHCFIQFYLSVSCKKACFSWRHAAWNLTLVWHTLTLTYLFQLFFNHRFAFLFPLRTKDCDFRVSASGWRQITFTSFPIFHGLRATPATRRSDQIGTWRSTDSELSFNLV